MALRVTPEEHGDKWARRMAASGQDMRQGAMRVRTAPGVSAAKSKQKMLTNLINAIESGDWERKVGAVSLEDWQHAYTSKGIQRVQQGVEASKDKVIESARALHQHIERIQAELANMPSNTLEDSIARQAHVTRRMAQFRA